MIFVLKVLEYLTHCSGMACFARYEVIGVDQEYSVLRTSCLRNFKDIIIESNKNNLVLAQ